MNRFNKDNRVRIDILDEGDPDHDLHGLHATVTESSKTTPDWRLDGRRTPSCTVSSLRMAARLTCVAVTCARR